MKIIDCDFHPSYQQIAVLDLATGEMVEKALSHERKEEVRAFYAGLKGSGTSGDRSQRAIAVVRADAGGVGTRDMDRGCGEDPRQLRAEAEDRPARCRAAAEASGGGSLSADLGADGAERDARQLLLHRHNVFPLVRMRTQVKNQLQALALNQGVQRKWKLWSAAGRKQLESLPLLPWASRRRAELLQLLDRLEASIGELDHAVAEQAYARPAARRLMTHPGVGPVTALSFTLTMGPAQRFQRGKQVASYLGLIPSEYSSGGHQQRLGHISKQGNPFLRGLLVEAAQSAVRYEPEMRRAYQRLAQRKCRALAEVARARKRAVRLYWMLRLQVNYAQLIQGSHAGQPGSFRGRG